jgi:hypothetical protein
MNESALFGISMQLIRHLQKTSPGRIKVPVIFLALSLVGSVAADSVPVSYNRQIRPLLSDKCFLCHGPDQHARKAKLRLDVEDSALEKKAIVRGHPEESALIKRIFNPDAKEVMPPPETHKSLKPEEKELLRTWIAEGAKYEPHWAYIAPAKASVPAGTNAVDYLIEERLRAVGLKPSPEADRRTLVRRLYSDLVGLPPRPEEVAEFVGDASPGAYERLVEKLLASPRYGERMAGPWLDIARFADTIGYHSDNPRNIWPYRDYVIRAFNTNKKFDTFTREQLAGDLLPESGVEQKVGSAFNRLLLSTEEGGAQPKDYEYRMLTDRVRAVGTVWLGQTFGCATCHDHKFDPIKMKDFYSMGAFFADIKEPIIGAREPGMLLPDKAQGEELARLQKEVERLKSISPLQDSDRSAVTNAERAVTALEASIPKCLVTISTAERRVVHILPRGDFLRESAGEIVEPALPAYLPGARSSTPEHRLDRLELANWLVSRENPLTARVTVNRLWKQFFGIGLSKVLDDLGSQGEAPPNQALLDWLACEFVDSGWDMKHMVRLMVTSRAYRQASAPSPELRERDPYNREVACQGRWRLDAELVRDTALSLGGILNLAIGGPSAKPYQPAGYWDNLNFPTRTYEPSTGPDQLRRGLYTWWQRSYLHPSLAAFDAPTREECAAERNRSNIPQQALVLLNDPTYVEASRAFGLRIMREGGKDTRERIAWAWRQALARDPEEVELKALVEMQSKFQTDYARDRSAAEAFLKVGQTPFPEGTDVADLASWAQVARAILNLHETITRS